MSTTSQAMIILSVILSILFLSLAIYAVIVFTSVARYAKYWQAGNQKPVADTSIVLVALGDSTAQGIGATSPTKGFVGQVASRLAKEKGQSVQVYNYSKTGAEAGEVLAEQLTQPDIIKQADLVLVAVGPNDLNHDVALEEYLNNYQAILDKLPKDRVVIASIPPLMRSKIRGNTVDDWNRDLKQLAHKNKVRVAPVYEAIKPHAYDPRIYSVDLFHPSNHGYSLWAGAFYEQVQKLEFPGVIQ